MKTIFEPSDLIGDKAPFILGRIVRRGPKDEHWIIGYDPGKRDEEGKYHLTSCRDGMLHGHYSSQTLCDHLNKQGYEVVVDLQYAEERLR